MIYSTKKLREAKKKQKQSQSQQQRGKTTLNLNGGGEHAFAGVSLRRLKTSYSLRMNTYHEISQVPSLHLMGNWLRKAEFEIGDYTTLVVSKGLIVIRKEENPEC
jgi:toxic protein SymE